MLTNHVVIIINSHHVMCQLYVKKGGEKPTSGHMVDGTISISIWFNIYSKIGNRVAGSPFCSCHSEKLNNLPGVESHYAVTRPPRACSLSAAVCLKCCPTSETLGSFVSPVTWALIIYLLAFCGPHTKSLAEGSVLYRLSYTLWHSWLASEKVLCQRLGLSSTLIFSF